mgnify:CR=1 FL=1
MVPSLTLLVLLYLLNYRIYDTKDRNTITYEYRMLIYKKTILLLTTLVQFSIGFSQSKTVGSIFENTENWKWEIIEFFSDWAVKVQL